MNPITQFLSTFAGYVWGLPLAILLVASGLLFTIRSGGLQFRKFKHALLVIRGDYDNPDDPGAINHFQALSAALSATIGLGNIAGVAWAIVTGGPGAMFWMWLIGLLGMATKFFTCTLAVKYRTEDSEGSPRGGPMYYIEQGLGASWKWLATLFAVFVMVSSMGIGNMFQSNQAGVALHYYFGVDKWITGLALSALVAVVIIGGIRRIGTVAGRLVPFMCLIYVIGALIIILLNITLIPSMIALILKDAFTGSAVAGGALGVVIQTGFRRAVFSNEAGLGSAPIAHSAAKTNEPVREGLVAMIGPFIDTIVICTMTALVITISGLYTDSALIETAQSNSDLKGVIVTTEAFNKGLPGFGKMIVSLGVVLFAFSTIISWSFYGETGAFYLFGQSAILPYRIVFVIMLFIGAVWKLGPIINLCDIMNGFMAVPTLLGTILLSGLVVRELGIYVKKYQ